MDKIEKIDCTTCKYGYEDERLGIPMCHHPKRFSEDCVDFNMHEEKRLEDRFNKSMEEAAEEFTEQEWDGLHDAGGNALFSEDYIQYAFKAGAEWQKEQMLKDAIYYVVQDDLDSHGASYNIPFIRIGTTALKPKGIGVGDKVRLIVLKEEEE